MGYGVWYMLVYSMCFMQNNVFLMLSNVMCVFNVVHTVVKCNKILIEIHSVKFCQTKSFES